ncbi:MULTISPECIES: hypothetical protein [unclassified Bradyrhizobium]|nr:hypothetical protein [Bradyrhizobium sp. USDA 4541]
MLRAVLLAQRAPFGAAHLVRLAESQARAQLAAPGVAIHPASGVRALALSGVSITLMFYFTDNFVHLLDEPDKTLDRMLERFVWSHSRWGTSR